MLDGDKAAPLHRKKGHSSYSHFAAHLYCAQTAGLIKMPLGLGREVGLGAGHNVLDGDTTPSPRKGGGTPPSVFGPSLLWPNGWMDQDATWYGVRLRPAGIVLDGGPAPPQRRRTTSPTFQPISVVAKRLDASRCQVRR